MAAEKSSSDARQQRLAKALKANIAKRKAQAKARAAEDDSPQPPADEDSCPN